MSLPKFTSYMISNQPDQTAYLLNKLVQEGVGGTGGGDIKLYDTTGQNTDGAMTQKATTNALGTKADTITVGNQLAGKVDKETGKGLSSNDFTDEDLTKLNGIEAGAEVNVQADWDQTDTSADDYIKNKPTIPAGAVLYNSTGQNTDGAMTQKATTDALGLKADSSTVSAQLANKVDKEAGKGLSSNDFTDEDKTKLTNIPTNIMTTDTAQTVTGTKTFHNAEIATDNMITLKNNSTSLIRGMAGIEYRQLLKRGSTDVEVGNNHDPLALKGSGTRPKYNSTNLLVDSDLDNVVFHDDPSTVVPTTPYVNTGDIVNGAVTSDKIDLSTLVTDWVTVASGTSWSVEYQKFGPIVFVRGHSQGVVSIPANSTYNSIATLPVGCRPSKQVLGFVSLQGGTQSASRYYRIAPDGIVSIYNRDNGVDTSFSYWEFYSVFLAN